MAEPFERNLETYCLQRFLKGSLKGVYKGYEGSERFWVWALAQLPAERQLGLLLARGRLASEALWEP